MNLLETNVKFQFQVSIILLETVQKLLILLQDKCHDIYPLLTYQSLLIWFFDCGGLFQDAANAVFTRAMQTALKEPHLVCFCVTMV